MLRGRRVILATLFAVAMFFGGVGRVKAGGCNVSYGTYSDAECKAARSASQGISCPSGGYSYYSCNEKSPGEWWYCYGCHVIGGTDVCPSECRKNSCGNGYVGAADCGKITPTKPNFGCKSNQACCRAKSCGPPACSNTSPSVPSLIAPSANAVTTSTNVTLSWSPVSSWGKNCGGNSDLYEIYIQPCAAAPAAIANPTTLLAIVGSTVNSRSYTGSAGTSYCWKIRATNGSNSADSEVRRFAIQQNMVRGTVYNDIDGNCGGPPSTFSGMSAVFDVDPVGGSKNSVAVSAVNGTYSIVGAPAGFGTLSLLNYPVNYMCSPCSSGCVQGSVANPSSNKNFYLTRARAAWWQVVGGGIYAGQGGSGVTVRSQLPTTTQKLIIPGAFGGEAALVKNSRGNPSLGTGSLSTNSWSTVSKYRGDQMDYEYFANKIGLTSSTADNWLGSSNIAWPPTPAGNDFYYIKPTGGTASINTTINVPVGGKYIVFVDGNLRINSNINTPVGAFIAFIVKGNITISPVPTNVAGIFLMDKSLITESAGAGSDVRVYLRGSYIAWSGVSLRRDLGSSSNISTPAEQFVYRPDYLVYMPDIMKNFALNWQEVAPGTFGQ